MGVEWSDDESDARVTETPIGHTWEPPDSGELGGNLPGFFGPAARDEQIYVILFIT